MKYITNKDIDSLGLSAKELVNLVDDTLKNKKDDVLPPKISMKINPDNFYNVMPCIMPKFDIAGVKVVNRYPNNKPCLKSNLLLYDYRNGDLKAFFDADLITTLRTSAVAIHSINLFAKDGFKSVAFIGMGEIGRTTLKFFLDYFGDDYVLKIYNHKNCAERIIQEFKNYSPRWEVYESYEDCIKNTDVVISAVTYMQDDFVSVECFKPGCLVVPIHTRGFMECDLAFDKVFGDDEGHLRGFKYYNQFLSRFAEVSSVLNGENKGRTSDTERIICYNIGIAIHDIALANHIFNKLTNQR